MTFSSRKEAHTTFVQGHPKIAGSSMLGFGNYAFHLKCLSCGTFFLDHPHHNPVQLSKYLMQAYCVPATSMLAQTVKCLPTMWETRVQSLGWEDLLDKEMATHSSILAWKIPWTEEPGRLQSMGLQRVGHD